MSGSVGTWNYEEGAGGPGPLVQLSPPPLIGEKKTGARGAVCAPPIGQ